ncbi:MAG: lipopolysaccharide heptosyltransferase II [Phycisphaerae bacterium]
MPRSVQRGAAAAPQRILLIKPSSLGDVVHGLPVLAALRAAHPRAHIAWLIGRAFAPLLRGHPLIDELIEFDRRKFGRMLRNPLFALEFVRFARALRRRRFDLVIDLQGLFRSGLLAWLSGAPRRVGFAAAREFAWAFYSERVECPADARHAVDRNVHLARTLGLAIDRPKFPLALTDGERQCTAALADTGPFVAVLPGARWTTKRWPASSFAALIDRIHAEDGRRCVMIGGPDDRELADEITRGCANPPLNLVGATTLRQAAVLIERSLGVICVDSGPMHIAAALNKPIVALFGPTDPARTGPYSSSAEVVTHPVDCAPCLSRSCRFAHQNCLRELSVEAVYRIVKARIPSALQAR